MATNGANIKGGRPRVSPRWREAVWTIYANEDPISSEAVRLHVEDLEHAWRRNDGPKPRTIRLLKQRFYNDLSPEQRQQYRLFRWPESMESGAIPWEASAALLDLQREHWRPQRIPNRVARWYWRATQAMPGASWRERLLVAGHLAAMEGMGQRPEVNLETLRSYLAYRPWEPEGAKAYDEAIESGRVVRYEAWVSVTSDDNLADLASNLIGMDSPAANWAVADILKHGPLASRPERELKGWVRRERKGRSK